MDAQTKMAAGVLSHVEAIYRPGDRQLATDLFEALGCKTYDTETPSLAGSSYISVHPDHSDRSLDNVLYLSEMTEAHCGLDDILKARLESDEELRAARDQYRNMADEKPFGLAHIAIRYPTYDMLEQVLAEAEQKLTPEMRTRASLRIFRPGDSKDIGWDSIQAFVYTDIAVSGISVFGQVFELSAYGEWS
ncbi:MAG: hypothetical protein P8J20_19770 [Novosphingobium sp.]|nr:hypothetical protein [Novosphingobium sp.]